MIIVSSDFIQNPLVSVVIATYNQVAYIEETILSVLAQQCSYPFEVIIADDGSNDGERELLCDLQKKYPKQLKLIFNEKNLMVARNYVNAIREAKGKYIATLDGDDYWNTTDKLQRQVDILEMNSDISIVYTGYRKFESSTKKTVCNVKTWKCVALNKKGVEAAFAFALGDIDYPLGSSACFRKDGYLYGCDKYEPLISTPYCAGEGTILNVSMCMTGYFYFIPEIMVSYRVLPDSLSHFEKKEELILFTFKYLKQRLLIAELLDLDKVKILNHSLWKIYCLAVINGMLRIYISELKKMRSDYKTQLPERPFRIYSSSLMIFLGSWTTKFVFLLKNVKN